MKNVIKKVILCNVIAMIFWGLCFGQKNTIQARELGKGGSNTLMEDASIKFSLKNFPRVWTGTYDGVNGKVPVNRKYVLKITSVDERTGEFEGVGYVSKGVDKPQYQVNATYHCKGTIDVAKMSIQWQGTSFIDDPGNFAFLVFTANYSKDLTGIEGITDAYEGAKIHLVNAVSNVNTDSFNYEENTVNYDLANECMELSLLVYGNAALDGNGYYVNAKNSQAASNALKNKLTLEGFSKESFLNEKGTKIKLRTSAKEKDNTKDCIHWVTAEKEMPDGKTLVYIIVKGTTGDEWYGNFNMYDEALLEQNNDIHYSFQSAADALYEDVNALYQDKKDIKYVVTGHSRGAAVANILAKKLTDAKESNQNIEAVYGYTFATPATINKEKSGNYTNIFNYCFDDDFVTYMPLSDSDWQYGRYGKTYCVTAADLNKKYSYFQKLTKNFFLKNPDAPFLISYKADGAYNIAKELNAHCASVPEFYAKKNYIEAQNGYDASWYEYFYYLFAPLMGGKSESWNMATVLTNKDFLSVTSKFIVGAAGYVVGAPTVQAYVGNTHDPGSYYALTQLLKYKTDAQTELVDYSDSSIRNKLAAEYPASSRNVSSRVSGKSDAASALSQTVYNEEEINFLKQFAAKEDNLALLGWDLENPDTWQQIQWNEEGNVTEINVDSIGLTGDLDLSIFTSLEKLDCTNNKLTNLELPEKTSVDVYCDGNYLSVIPTGNLYKKLAGYAENGSIVSFADQSIPENARFNTSELNKLKAFAKQDDNLEKLGWTLEEPDTYTGVRWTLNNGYYYVQSIELADMELTGKADLSGFSCVTDIDLSGNQLENVINVSGDNLLTELNVSNNKITALNIDRTAKLQTLFCSNNYLAGTVTQRAFDLADAGKDAVVEIYPQYTDASAESFDEAELFMLQSIIGDTLDDIDWTYPGLNDRFQWTKEGETYYLEKLDLSDTDISGEIDLGQMAHLEEVNFENTDITSVTLPYSLTKVGNYAFAYCPHLTAVMVTDNWKEMGINTFYASPDVTIVSTRDTFAQFVANALDIPFEEIVRMTYIEMGKEPTEPYILGQEFSLNGGELTIHYSDGSSKSVTDGYTVSGFDPEKEGEQNVTISYSEDNYTKETTMRVEVYACDENGYLYQHTDNKKDKIKICGYIGQEQEITIPSQIDGTDVVEIYARAFWKNQVITKVTIPDCITTVNYRAFAECEKLEEVILPDVDLVLGEAAFMGCKSLKKVHLNAGLTLIPVNLFKDCSSLVEVNIPDSVEEIEVEAFSNCISLGKLTLPEGLQSVGNYAFIDAKIQTVEYAGSEEQLRNIFISDWSNEAILEREIKTLADGHTVVLQPRKDDDPIPTPSASSAPINNGQTPGPSPSQGNTEASSQGTAENVNPTMEVPNSSEKNKVHISKVNGLKIKKSKAKKNKLMIKVSWKKMAKASGYQLQYAQNKSFTKGRKTKMCSAMKQSITIKNLKKAKRYYVRIRAYKIVQGKKVYGKWSVK